ncbi:MAG: nuclear transport factor 2 family protein [Longimicrobiales bacterium]
MTTESTIDGYFKALSSGDDWQAYVAEDIAFTSHGTPEKHVTGRDPFIASTKGFYSMIRSIEVRQLIIDGDRACALTRYVLQPPKGEPFTSDVAEIFAVRDDLIDSFEIYFDSAPYPTPNAPQTP